MTLSSDLTALADHNAHRSDMLSSNLRSAAERAKEMEGALAAVRTAESFLSPHTVDSRRADMITRWREWQRLALELINAEAALRETTAPPHVHAPEALDAYTPEMGQAHGDARSRRDSAWSAFYDSIRDGRIDDLVPLIASGVPCAKLDAVLADAPRPDGESKEPCEACGSDWVEHEPDCAAVPGKEHLQPLLERIDGLKAVLGDLVRAAQGVRPAEGCPTVTTPSDPRCCPWCVLTVVTSGAEKTLRGEKLTFDEAVVTSGMSKQQVTALLEKNSPKPGTDAYYDKLSEVTEQYPPGPVNAPKSPDSPLLWSEVESLAPGGERCSEFERQWGGSQGRSVVAFSGRGTVTVLRKSGTWAVDASTPATRRDLTDAIAWMKEGAAEEAPVPAANPGVRAGQMHEWSGGKSRRPEVRTIRERMSAGELPPGQKMWGTDSGEVLLEVDGKISNWSLISDAPEPAPEVKPDTCERCGWPILGLDMHTVHIATGHRHSATKCNQPTADDVRAIVREELDAERKANTTGEAVRGATL